MVFFDNKIITLNSAYGYKQNGTLSSFVLFNFQGLLKEETNILRSYVSVINAQFPVSFYTINATNNTLTYIYNVPTITTKTTITIASGNYNASSLISALTNAFTANTIPITTAINKLTGKLTFSAPLNFAFYQSTTSLMSVLGFSNTNTFTSTAGSLSALYPLNLLGVKVISIKSAILAISAYTSETLGFSNTLATVPINAPSFNLVSYDSNNSLNKHILRTKHIDAIDITISDENENLIDFNNIDWTLTLCLSIEREDAIINNLDLHQVVRETAITPEIISEPEKELTQNEKELNLLSNT
jgi:hypothetical protein